MYFWYPTPRRCQLLGQLFLNFYDYSFAKLQFGFITLRFYNLRNTSSTTFHHVISWGLLRRRTQGLSRSCADLSQWAAILTSWPGSYPHHEETSTTNASPAFISDLISSIYLALYLHICTYVNAYRESCTASGHNKSLQPNLSRYYLFGWRFYMLNVSI